MNTAPPGAAYRFREFQSKPHAGKGYRHSIEVSDEASGAVLCACHVTGNACLTPLEILQPPQAPLRLLPDRKVMPGRWTLSAADGQTIAAFARRSLASALVNPLGKAVLTVLDGTGAEAGQLIDPRSSTADRVMGAGPDEWHLVRGSELLARLTRLPAQKPKPTTMIGRMLDVFTSSDRAFVSSGPAHALGAPAALALLLLSRELTETTG